MQQSPSAILTDLRNRFPLLNRFAPNRRGRGRGPLLGAILGVLLAGGCGVPSSADPGVLAGKPHAGVALTLRCPDRAFATAITPAIHSWETRTGARVELLTEPMQPGDGSDAGVIGVPEFGAWAERGDLVQVPAAVRALDHPFQWTNILPAYRQHLVEWGGQARAIPLAGEGHVIVYRLDRATEVSIAAAFQKHGGAKPGVLDTWEEVAALAAAFAEVDGKPSLAPMSRHELADLFFRVAACYDRPLAVNDAAVAKQGGGYGTLSFQHDLRTASPRVAGPGFAAAAEWLAGLHTRKSLPPLAATNSDPAGELAAGRAMVAVVSLAQLAKLPRESGRVPARFSVVALPGTQRVADPNKKQLVRLAAPNYVPYHAGGRLGVVRTTCPHPDAAFDLLAEIGGPARSLEIVGNPDLGAGPFRFTHLDQERLVLWLGYGFDANRSKALQTDLRINLRNESKNAVYTLRGPDQRELTDAAVEVVAKLAVGGVAAEESVRQLAAAWQRIDEKTPVGTRTAWRKRAAGLE